MVAVIGYLFSYVSSVDAEIVYVFGYVSSVDAVIGYLFYHGYLLVHLQLVSLRETNEQELNRLLHKTLLERETEET